MFGTLASSQSETSTCNASISRYFEVFHTNRFLLFNFLIFHDFFNTKYAPRLRRLSCRASWLKFTRRSADILEFYPPPLLELHPPRFVVLRNRWRCKALGYPLMADLQVEKATAGGKGGLLFYSNFNLKYLFFADGTCSYGIMHYYI